MGSAKILDKQQNANRKPIGPGGKLFRLLFENLKTGKLTVHWPDGSQSEHAGEQGQNFTGVLEIKNPRFFRRVLRGGALGFAESYMDGDWRTPDLSGLLEVLSLNLSDLDKHIGNSRLLTALQRMIHVMRPNTRRGSRKNIHAHYDLGNDFYQLWLDPSMTYSSARFQETKNSLESAQHNKYKALADMMDLKAGHHVLEIGCGWGGFAEFAASEIGCKVTGLTISNEQLDFAQQRMINKGINDHVELRFQDYRDVSEKYDRVVSIEMFEAVGEKYWPTYFDKVHHCLKKGGKAGLQIITIDNEKFKSYRKKTDFIQKYIFPGGMLPSPARLREEFERARLHLVEKQDFSLDYAKTLAKWRHRFVERWVDIQPLGFDTRFKRMWEYYLAYCEAGFRSNSIDVSQFLLEKK